METPSELTDRYHVTSHIARGGMADVYEGQDTLLNRNFAKSQIKLANAGMLMRHALVYAHIVLYVPGAEDNHHRIVFAFVGLDELT